MICLYSLYRPPGNPCFCSNLCTYPMEFQQLLLFHWNFPLISSTGELRIFPGKGHSNMFLAWFFYFPYFKFQINFSQWYNFDLKIIFKSLLKLRLCFFLINGLLRNQPTLSYVNFYIMQDIKWCKKNNRILFLYFFFFFFKPIY